MKIFGMTVISFHFLTHLHHQLPGWVKVDFTIDTLTERGDAPLGDDGDETIQKGSSLNGLNKVIFFRNAVLQSALLDKFITIYKNEPCFQI